MRGKLTLLIGFGAGYVLGTRSGRERYDKMAGRAKQVWKDPRVQEKAAKAQHVAQEKAGQAGHAVQEKVQEAAGQAGHAVKEKISSSDSTATSPHTPGSHTAAPGARPTTPAATNAQSTGEPGTGTLS